MSESLLITLLLAPWAGIALVLSWQYVHQKSCGEWREKFKEEHGTLKADVEWLKRKENER
jgi:hypothetical protein